VSRCAIALGGNIGPTALIFDRAIELLERSGYAIESRSANFDTTPMGASAGQQFLNAAAVLNTDTGCWQVLNDLHAVESALGRERTISWGPRIIDLDLLLYDDIAVDANEIVVPHPPMWYRRFTLEPLQEIAPDWLHPLLNSTIQQLYDRLLERPLKIKISGNAWNSPIHQTVLNDLNRRFGVDFELLPERTSLSEEELFATVDFRRSTGGHEAFRSQPPQMQDRTIPITVRKSDAAEFEQHFADIAAAILG
jgi:2-amino-4-hydroxy-6-hydroxymethyldihydropteridine diphosphokinase